MEICRKEDVLNQQSYEGRDGGGRKVKIVKFRQSANFSKRIQQDNGREERELTKIPTDEMLREARNLEQEVREQLEKEEKKEAQEMLDRMLDMIHADPEMNAKAQAYVQVPKEQDCAQKNRKRRKRLLKVISGTAASLAVLLVITMSSKAARRYWFRKVQSVLWGRPLTTVDSGSGFINEREYTELQAFDLIERHLGGKAIYLRDIPDGMTFEDVYIEDGEWAKLYYLYDGKYVTILIDKTNTNTSLGKVYDGKDAGGIKVNTAAADIAIHKIQRDDEGTAFYAEFEEADMYYSIVGDMDEELFVEMVASVEFW